MPIAPVNAMMQQQREPGATGESRSSSAPTTCCATNSVFSESNDTLTTAYSNPLVDAALAGQPASGVTTDYRGMPMLATAMPLEFNGAHWAIVTTMARTRPMPRSTTCAT